MEKLPNYQTGGAKNLPQPLPAYSSRITNTFRGSSLIPWFFTPPSLPSWFILFFSYSLIL
jgi:hypothetical protein